MVIISGCQPEDTSSILVSIANSCFLRLMVRTPPFHGGNRGSIPLGNTIHHFLKQHIRKVIIMVIGLIANERLG